MENIKFLGFPLEKSQDISLLITDLVKKLMKEILLSGYCSKNHPKISKALLRLTKNFENFWTNIS